MLDTTQIAPTAPAPAPKPGRKFTRALRRAAERELSADQRAPVRDARGVVRQRAADQDRRAAVARYATRQQVARNRAQQARASAEEALRVAEEAVERAHQESKDPREVGAAMHSAERARLYLADLERLPLPEVPPVPPAGKPAEIPYVGGAALVVNRYAHLPAGTTAARRREPTATGWLPARLR